MLVHCNTITILPSKGCIYLYCAGHLNGQFDRWCFKWNWDSGLLCCNIWSRLIWEHEFWWKRKERVTQM